MQRSVSARKGTAGTVDGNELAVSGAALNRPLRVIVVEDQPNDAELVIHQLQTSGYTATWKRVDSEGDFLACLAEGADLILADFEMPEFGALRALESLRDSKKDIPFIIVSGTIGEEVAVEALKYGADDYLMKDRLGRLGQAVAQALEQRRLRNEERRAREIVAASEKHFRLLAENARDFIYRLQIHPELKYEYASPAVETFTGYPPEAFYANPNLVFEIVHPADRERFLKSLHDPSQRETGPLRWLRTDGSVIWTEGRIVEVCDSEGRVVAIEGIARDVTEQRAREEQLRKSVEALRELDSERRRLLTRLVDAQEEERQRIAGDIHDDSIQIVVAAGIRLDVFRRRLTDPAEIEELETITETVQHAVERLRRLLFDLRPPALDREGFAAALRSLLDQSTSDDGLECDFVDCFTSEPPAECRLILYRIAQEAITNVRKHAQARRITVRTDVREGGFLVCVEDDGVGIDEQSETGIPGHLGMVAMRERAELAGGWFNVEKPGSKGTRVTVWIPDPSRV